ncbi:MAG TPA: hypothetical protein VD866_17475 [Urbifossiella sp.]|nr:hypothetical protein [Urbifossiella sp.]
MFRKLILTAVVATVTAATAAAQPLPIPHGPHGPGRHDPHGPGRHDPHGPRTPQRDRHDYEVLVRHHGHWDRYRVFDDLDEARRAVWRLERTGRDARIEVIHRHW